MEMPGVRCGRAVRRIAAAALATAAAAAVGPTGGALADPPDPTPLPAATSPAAPSPAAVSPSGAHRVNPTAHARRTGQVRPAVATRIIPPAAATPESLASAAGLPPPGLPPLGLPPLGPPPLPRAPLSLETGLLPLTPGGGPAASGKDPGS